MQKLPQENKRTAILSTALTTFKLYGYRKTSMLDIATALGISRASLYSYFENKEDIFRCVTISMAESALEESKRCLGLASLDLTSRIEAALLARYLPYQQTLIESAYAAELYEAYRRICDDIYTDTFTQSQDMFAAALKSANRKKEIDLKAASITAPAASEVLNLTIMGLRQSTADVEIYKKRVNRLVRVFMRGLRSASE